MPSLASHPRPISLDLMPVEAATRCRHLAGCVFFDTAVDSNGAEISIVAARPAEVIRGRSDADWERLRARLKERHSPNEFDAGFPNGMAAGYVEYEGEFCFGIYPDALVFRHWDQTWHEVGRGLDLLRRGGPDTPTTGGPHFSPRLTREQFCGMVTRAQEYIAQGDIYQVSLAHLFSARWRGEAFHFYESLRHYSPAPNAAFLEFDGRAILSASPESFLKMSGRAIRTRPIKGTRPRLAEANADALSAYELRTSAKETAELVMITDLERNDLGRVCEYGSVKVAELLKLERFEQVYHLVSTVEGELREDLDHIEALRTCFPGGSITGAPKKRAREIIAELEPWPRGLYTGAMGWLGFNGESQFNIAIRTVIIENGEAHFHVGAGIVADSVPAQEWEETLHKAAGILLAAERFGRD